MYNMKRPSNKHTQTNTDQGGYVLRRLKKLRTGTATTNRNNFLKLKGPGRERTKSEVALTSL